MSYCIIAFVAARTADWGLLPFGCLSCIDFLSAEFACEGKMINKVWMKNGLKDAFVIASHYF